MDLQGPGSDQVDQLQQGDGILEVAHQHPAHLLGQRLQDCGSTGWLDEVAAGMALAHQNANRIGTQLDSEAGIFWPAHPADLHANSRFTHGTMRAFVPVSPCP